MNPEQMSISLQKGIKHTLGEKKAIVGIYGDVNSAVVSFLCVNAVGKDRVIGVQMPYKDQSVVDGTRIINQLGIGSIVINIEPIIKSFQNQMFMFTIDKLVNGDIHTGCCRTLLCAIAGLHGGTVIGNGNKTDILGLYFDFNETEVFELAKYLGVPDSIIRKTTLE